MDTKIKTNNMIKLASLLILFWLSIHVLHASVFYVDPINGDINNPGTENAPWSTIQEVIESNYIISQSYANLPFDSMDQSLIVKNPDGFVAPGDTLILKGGLHGEIFLRNYVNLDYISILGAEGERAIVEKVNIKGGKNWRFENIEVSTEPYGYYLGDRLFFIESHGWQGPCSHMEILNCRIYSTETPWNDAIDWVDKSSSGLYLLGDSLVAKRNYITNVDHGLTAIGDYIIAERNSIDNFSGDGMRPLGSYINFNYNLIKNCYNVDENHDDGIQSFTTNGHVVDFISIIGNVVINTDDPERPLNGPLQGIVGFDGMYNNWVIANNLVNVNHWHGISLYGARNCSIINNTVIDPSPDIEPGASWIRINDNDDGTMSTNNIVGNNVCNKIVVPSANGNIVDSNVELLTYDDYLANFVDYLSADFRLLAESELIDNGNIDYASALDILEEIRDTKPDIGAYEYFDPLNTMESKVMTDVIIFPNPFSEYLEIGIDCENYDVEIINVDGMVLQKLGGRDLNKNLSVLNQGIYFLRFSDRSQSCFNTPVTKRVIKI